MKGAGPGTTFSWSGDSHVFVLRLVSMTEQSNELYIVTAKTSVQLPDLDSFKLASATAYTWQVETHTSAASVDEAVSKGELISPFWFDQLRGPRRGSGSYTTSEQRVFTAQ
jgi:hypothetical protein